MQKAVDFLLDWTSIRLGDLLRSSVKLCTCTVDDCHATYQRKDHLTQHALQHKGRLIECPIENCSHEFAFQGNMMRHVREFHSETSTSSEVDGEKRFPCTESGCGKVFKYPSKLRKHEDSHVKLDSVDAMCLHPCFFKQFSNANGLKAHIQTCHSYIACDICGGSKQLKKNIKRHRLR